MRVCCSKALTFMKRSVGSGAQLKLAQNLPVWKGGSSLPTTTSSCYFTFSSRRLISSSMTLQKTYEHDEPVPFTGSDADRHSIDTFAPPVDTAPWYQRHVLKASLIIFMLYFFILREENDIDEFLTNEVMIDPHHDIVKLQRKIEEGQRAGLNTVKLEKQLEKFQALLSGDESVLDKQLQDIKEAKQKGQSVIEASTARN